MEKKTKKKLKDIIKEHKERRKEKKKLTKEQKKRIIIGISALIYLCISLCSCLSTCVNASSTGINPSNTLSNGYYTQITPFKSITYQCEKDGTSYITTIDMPHDNYGEMTTQDYYNQFTPVTETFTTEYKYNSITPNIELFESYAESVYNWAECTISIEDSNDTSIELNCQFSTIEDENGVIQPYFTISSNGYLLYAWTEKNSTPFWGSTSPYNIRTMYVKDSLTNINTYSEPNNTVSYRAGNMSLLTYAWETIYSEQPYVQEIIDAEIQGISFLQQGTPSFQQNAKYMLNKYRIYLNEDMIYSSTEDEYKVALWLRATNFIADIRNYDGTNNNRMIIEPSGGTTAVNTSWIISDYEKLKDVATGAATVKRTSFTVNKKMDYSQTNFINNRYGYFLNMNNDIVNQYATNNITVDENFIVDNLTVAIYFTFDTLEEATNTYVDITIPYQKGERNTIDDYIQQKIGTGYLGNQNTALPENPTDFIEYIVIAADGFFTTDILGIASLGDILWFAVGVGILFAVLKYFAGG